MDRLLIILIVALMLLGFQEVAGQEIRRKNLIANDSIPQVIVDGDTVDVVIPQKNYGRYDRGLFNYLFIPKNKWGFGITASYGELETEDSQILSILKDFDFKGKMYSLKPSVQYFISHNQSVGLRVDYSRGEADLNNMSFDFDESMSFTIRDVSYYQQSISMSAFYRNYVGLDRSGRFGVFNEVEFKVGSGSSRFKRLYGGEPKDTRTMTTQGAINFSPGVCIFIQDMMSFQLSFGVFGLKWKREEQTTDGIDEGLRETSGANFKFNIFNINFGLMVVI